MNYPSIFNDVLGPVMRGPSSSHCAASVRIGKSIYQMMKGNIKKVTFLFDTMGSLATTHESQGSDMGLCAGLLNCEPDDETLLSYKEAIDKANINVQYFTDCLNDAHPNTYRIEVSNEIEKHSMIAISTGGGMFEITKIDDASISYIGDRYFCLIKSSIENLKNIPEIFNNPNLVKHSNNYCIINSFDSIDNTLLVNLTENNIWFSYFEPVIPIRKPENLNIPFITVKEMIDYNKNKHLSLPELAVKYESIRGGISENEVIDKMKHYVSIWKKSIDDGLKGTNYKDRILGSQSPQLISNMNTETLLKAPLTNTIIAYVTALMEVKSSMGVIIAAPTAGSCGAVPGAIIGTAEALNYSNDKIVDAFLAAGLIGIFISAHATFAAEVGGCQAECGAGSGMAAAALTTFISNDFKQGLCAASLALQNILGMVCDPVANRVEVPCLGKNVMAATNALSCANMALANYDCIVPLDQVISTMYTVGKSLPHELRCTALGGLSICNASKKIETDLKNNCYNQNSNCHCQ